MPFFAFFLKTLCFQMKKVWLILRLTVECFTWFWVKALYLHFYTSILKKNPFLQRYDNFTKFCSTVLFCVPSETIFSGWFSVHKINPFWHKNALRTFYMTTRVDISCINFFHIFSFQKKEWSFQPCLARPFFCPLRNKI